jgi:GDPmannose 4,6-dehydratase
VRALITGVTGQDGWYLSELLVAQGHEVFGLVVDLDTAQLPPGVRPLSGDMSDTASLAAALDDCRPAELYNLASISSVARSWNDPALVADVNGVGVLRLLDQLRRRDWTHVRFVQAGSAEIFGDAAAPQSEATPLRPVTPYGVAKALAQHAVLAYRTSGLWAASVILYNHESPRRPVGFVTRKITKAVAGIATGAREPLVLGTLDVRRDWGFAGDYAEAMTLVARHERPDDFVVSSGVSHTIAEFVAAAFAHVGIDDWRPWVRIDADLRRPADAAEQRGDSRHIRETLGWRPRIDFQQLVAAMVDADLARIGATESVE